MEYASHHAAATGPGFASLRGPCQPARGAFTSLYALGLDAWNIRRLDMMRRDPDFRFPALRAPTVRKCGECFGACICPFIRGLPVPLDSTTINADTGDNN
jgi:hypothetical protein